MNVLDSMCSVLTSLERQDNIDIVLSGGSGKHQIQIPSQIIYKFYRCSIESYTKLVNTLHLESNTFILYIVLWLDNPIYYLSTLGTS
jgi:hypothetical protein